MKILFLINGLGTGGAERSLAEMLPLLVQAGCTPVIVCFYRRTEGVEESVLAQGYDVRFIAETGYPARTRVLRRITASVRPDLLHTTLFEADLTGRLAMTGKQIPVLSSLVNTSYSRVRLADERIQAWKLWTARMIDGWTARHLTSHFHAITETVKQAAVRDLGVPAERITVVERGRNPKRLGLPSLERRFRVRHALGIGENQKMILNVGRQEYQKGQRYLLEAMSRVVETCPDAMLLIAGRAGNATSDLDALHRELQLQNKVYFLCHRDDLPDILAAADLFVFPSLYEGLGGALIEAMALGLPIVASDLPVFREVLEPGRNALLVTPGNSRELAAGIQTLLADEERATAFGKRGRQIFEERFTLERSVHRMIELYQTVVDKGR